MFRDAGLEKAGDDPAVLSVKGRLLKDQAIAAKGDERRRLYGVSAAAYARAAKLSGQTYPLINAATLSLLAGRRAAARTLARQLLHSPKREEAETPYWRAATLAEAHLLLSDVEKAKAALNEAMSLAPRAYEDHASTLRQFGLILQELRLDDHWLAAFRPPRTAHFAGHIWMSGDDSEIARNIRAVIERERIGFAYGALAAGADILIAEALLEADADLHLVLPSPVAEFRKVSVVPSGAPWARRFDAILKHASSVQIVGTEADPRSPLAIQLASEVAMGLAGMQAERLGSEAVQLLVLAPEKARNENRSLSERLRRIWKKGGRQQHVLTAPRATSSRGPSQPEEQSECLAAFLHIAMAEAESLCIESLRRLAAALKRRHPLATPRWSAERIDVAFSTPAEAADAAIEVAGALNPKFPVKISGHYGVAHRMDDPFGGPPLIAGAAAAMPARIALSTPPGAIHLSENFAAALYAAWPFPLPRIEHIGELPAEGAAGEVKLFSLRE